MKRKKILFYHPLFLDGGAERTNLLISEKFSKKYEVIFVSNVFSKIYSSEIRRIGIKKIELKAKRTITSFFELSKIINKYKPDIIFSVQMHASILALLIWRRAAPAHPRGWAPSGATRDRRRRS